MEPFTQNKSTVKKENNKTDETEAVKSTNCETKRLNYYNQQNERYPCHRKSVTERTK